MFLDIFVFAALMASGVAGAVAITEARKAFSFRSLILGVSLFGVVILIVVVVLHHITPDDGSQAWLIASSRRY